MHLWHSGVFGIEKLANNIYESPASDMSFRKMHGIHADRLQKLKGKYDPTGMFGKMCPIMPAN